MNVHNLSPFLYLYVKIHKVIEHLMYSTMLKSFQVPIGLNLHLHFHDILKTWNFTSMSLQLPTKLYTSSWKTHQIVLCLLIAVLQIIRTRSFCLNSEVLYVELILYASIRCTPSLLHYSFCSFSFAEKAASFCLSFQNNRDFPPFWIVTLPLCSMI